jgi:hypothetical protein
MASPKNQEVREPHAWQFMRMRAEITPLSNSDGIWISYLAKGIS